MAEVEKQRLPRFAQWLARTDAPPGSTWGLWGENDELGTLNLLTDERTLAALGDVRNGQMLPLGLPLEEPATYVAHRTRPVHHFLRVGYPLRGGASGGRDDPLHGHVGRDDFVDGLQGSSSGTA